MEVTDRDRAAFEAGIKLGALYHQFVGTPISVDTVEDLSRTIEQSVILQPYVRSVSVYIDGDMVKKKQNPRFGYCELEGRMLHVSLQIIYKNTRAYAELSYDVQLDYPLMSINKVEEI